MDVSQKPTRDEIRRRAADLVPVLRANALASERNRGLTDETVQAMTDAGIFRLRIPERFGGYACDTRTLVDVGIELGRGDGSAAFNTAAWWIMSWNVGMFPDEVQEEVFTSPDVRVCGTLAPTAMAVPKDGGIVVSGQWNFNSGAAHSQWKLLSAILPDGEGGAEPVLAIAPMSAFEVEDDWEVSGLRGTGSVTLRTQDLFIPTAKYIKISALMQQQYASVLNRDLPIYRGPMVGAVSAATTGKIVGLAQAAREAFFERVPGRPITNTGYASQIEAPVTHLQVADADLKIDEAEYHARRLAEMVDGKGLRAEPWSLKERAYARMAVGRVCQLGMDAVNIYAMASGASSIYSTIPIQRIQRDMQTINLHALNLPSTNLELYGRILCGQEPNTFFV
ncbi:acyl-CoA dehydrogenase family protein [Micromonospora fiedleri]|uniref:Acyl-CoA dehydrogenase family protein n=1 Tax=Micromonospora fiedleri TaxID=1157498 RepID=A0ABS1UM08_9ACTN|nr:MULTISPECIES: acyl-CoA dehydrogenase family protein [Micromonospora]MBL6277365.1 acyl-CoA dehydrogenase family protein [Micromonospora fiedleri]WSK42222.1 acyl-CoA dehydrogenase family protein [Micromonospora maris]